jgi:hypothetical protein
MSTIVPDPDVRLGPFTTDDVVADTIVIPYEDDDGTPVDLTGSTPSTTLLAPDGAPAAAASTIDPDGALAVVLPAVPFDKPGEWALSTTLVTGTGSTVRVPGVRFVVEDVATGWLTLYEIRQEWRDAPASDVVLFRLLEVAKSQVLAYTPEPIPARPTPNLIGAQKEQARDVWNQTKTDPASIGIGDDVLTIRPFPMSPWIKDMIRPKQAKPVIA